MQSIALAAATFFFGKTVNSEQQKASDAKKGKDVAVSGLAQVAAKADKKREEHSAVPDTQAFLNSLGALSRQNPDLTIGHKDFADHIISVVPASLPSAEDDLSEIATLAKGFLEQAKSM